ncbi:MAG TPA: GTPase Era [Acidobacteriaceae bacterium]|nr:GTPase Era [Acidobacteriaceae bacterium]
MPFRSGFVSIIGRPNAGKSTLLNALLGQKLAIVTHKPQTTRTRIHGVLEVPARKKTKTTLGHPAAQVVLVDTPGVHKPSTQLDRRMMQEVTDALESRDVVLFIVDVTHRLPQSDKAASTPHRITGRMALSAAEDDFALSLVRRLDCPVILVLNKIDAVRKEELLPLIAHWSAQHTFAEVVPISARKKEGLNLLLEKIVALLPEGERYFPRDQVTDQPERFLAAELVREKILLLTGEEVPYASAVVIERFEEPGARTKKTSGGKLPVTKISAAIFCERAGQKAILIGKQGAMLKQIGTAARKEIESLLGTRVFLELFVKVQAEWRSSRGFVEELDWRRQLEELATRQQNKET